MFAMTAPDTHYGQHIQDSFDLARAIQASANEVLEREGDIDLPTLSALTIHYYSTWAHVISQGAELENGYDPRIIDAIRRFDYQPPVLSQGAEEHVRTAVLVPSLSDAVSSSLQETAGIQRERNAEESARASILLASQAAFLLNRIEDYRLNELDPEVHRFIGGISVNLRLQAELGVQLDEALPADPDERLGEVAMTDEPEVDDGQLAPAEETIGENVLPMAAETETEEDTVEEDEVEITIPDSNWSLPHLQHLVSLLSSRFKHTRIQREGKEVYTGFYPAIYSENKALTQAVLAKLGFDLSFFTDQCSAKRQMMRKDMMLRMWLEDTDTNFQSERESNPDAVLRTRAKSTIANAIHHTDRPQAGKTFTSAVRKRSVELLILDINKRIRLLQAQRVATEN